MGLQLAMAKAVGNTLSWGLRKVARRPGGTLPGKVGLRIDPQFIADLRGKVRVGSVVVVGTNGKTSVTNLVADAFEAAGRTVICNRTGANMGPAWRRRCCRRGRPSGACSRATSCGLPARFPS